MFHRLWYMVRIYGKLQILHLRVHLEYEVDFWIGIMGVMLKHATSLIFIWTIFRFIPEIHGWTMWEIALLYSLYIIPMGLVELLYDGQWELPRLVNKGEFDQVLTRPISPFLQVVTQLSSIHGFGSILLGGVVLSQVLQGLQATWGFMQYIFLIVTIFNSVLIIGSINFLTNCLVFWDPSPNAAFATTVQNITELARYPINLYDGTLQFLLTTILPLAFVTYFPSLILLGKQDEFVWIGYATPFIGPILFVATLVIWRISLHRYQGTGS